MASAVNELGQLLRGTEGPQHPEQQAAAAGRAGASGTTSPQRAAAAAAAAAGGAKPAGGPGVDISKLSQLSDFADKELQKDKPAAAAARAASGAAGAGASEAAVQFSQETLIEPPNNPLAFQQASQPDIPPPVLPESQNMSQLPPGSTPPGAASVAAAEEQQKQIAAAAAAVTLPYEQMMALMPGMLGMDWSHALVPHVDGEPSEMPAGPRTKSGKPTRRGPMDEMRQLVRILVKLLPQSIAYIGANEEAGGGNRISEEQIKVYLDKTLGDAPRPQWGVPNSWFGYVSELFSWALGRHVDEEATKKCAKREPGRSWEALEGELQAIGVHPHCWPLPLTLEGVREAEKNPVPQLIPQVAAVKRAGEGGEGTSRRGRSSVAAIDLDRYTEYELWKHLNDVLVHCSNKSNTSPPELAQSLGNLKSQAKAQMDVLAGGVGGLNMLQYVPVMGLDGNPSMMAFLGGMQGMPMGLPPVTGQLVGPDGQVLPDATAAAAAAAVAAGGMPAVPAELGGGTSGGEERAAKRVRREGEEGVGTSPVDGAEDGERRADKAKAPLSSSEARGTLFGALGGGSSADVAAKDSAGGAGGKQQAQQQQQLMQQAQQLGQLPLLYATQPGAAFMMPPGFAGIALPPGDGSGVPADAAAAAAAAAAPQPEGEA